MGDVDAEAIAQELVAKKTPLLREEIMQLAFYLPDQGNQGQHKAAGERGSAFFAGAYRHGGIARLRASCRSWPWSIQAITKYIQQKTPETVFTSFAILYDQEAKPHRDSGNEATPNVVIKLSDFQGGGLWIEDPLGQDARDIDGRVIPGTNTDFDQDTIVFNAKEALHMTLPWEGTRVVLAVYSVQGVDRIIGSLQMSLSSFCNSGSIRLRCRQATMRMPPGKSRLLLCAPKLQIASDRKGSCSSS